MGKRITICFFALLAAGYVYRSHGGLVLSSTPGTIGVIAALLLAAQALHARAWHSLVHNQGLSLSYGASLQAWFQGSFLGALIPLGMGRDAYRCYDVARRSGCARLAVGVLVQDRMLNGIALLVVLMGGLVLAPYGTGLIPAKMRSAMFMGGAGFLGGVLFLLLFRKVLLVNLLQVVPVPKGIASALQRCLQTHFRGEGRAGALGMALSLHLLAHVLRVAGIALLVQMALGTSSVGIQQLAAIPVLFYHQLYTFLFVVQPLSDWYAVAFTAAPQELLGQHVTSYALLSVGVGAVVYILRIKAERTTLEVAEIPIPALESSLSQGDLRRKVVQVLVMGFAGGWMGGACIGMAEALWTYQHFLENAQSLKVLWWAVMAYAWACSLLGLALGLGLSLVALTLNHFRKPIQSYATSVGLVCMAGLVVVGRFRYVRDVLGDTFMSQREILILLLCAVGILVLFEVMGWVLGRIRSLAPSRIVLGTGIIWLVMVVGGFYSAATLPQESAAVVLPEAQAEDKRPNVFFIVADTLRADHVSSLDPNSPVQTPGMDTLVADGVGFTQAYAQAAWTKPSFATLFTGLMVGQHKTMSKSHVLPESCVTFSEVLRDAGYFTHGIPNNRNITRAYGMAQGFHTFSFMVPDLFFGADLSAEGTALYQVLRRLKVYAQAPYLDVAHWYQPAPVVNDFAIEWLDNPERVQDRPFLLYTHYMDTHDPYNTHDGSGIAYSATVLGWDPDQATYEEAFKESYIAEVQFMDRYIGDFIMALEERGLYEDSLIIFTSDHGEELFEHGGWLHGPTLYNEVIQIPLIIKYPGNAHGGTLYTDLVRHLDVAPTIIDMAGATVPESMQGVSLVPTGDQPSSNAIRHTVAETNFLGNRAQSIQNLDWKFIEALSPSPRGLLPQELYHLEEDPGEQHNLVEEASKRIEGLQKDLHEADTLHNAER